MRKHWVKHEIKLKHPFTETQAPQVIDERKLMSIKPLFSTVLPIICFCIALSSSPFAIADDLSDLLKQTDEALTKPQKKAVPPAASKIGPSTKKQQAKKSPQSAGKKQPQNSGASGLSTSPSKPVLGPADAASVDELIRLGASRQAQLNPNERRHTIGVALGRADLQGSYEVSKDDDTFKVQDNAHLKALLLQYSFDLLEDSPSHTNGLNLGTINGQRLKFIPLMGLDTGYLVGNVNVERTGIQSGDQEVEYTVIPVGGHFGIRTSPLWGISLNITYGLGMDMLLQTGQGQSDSTSGFFTTDYLNMAATYILSKAYSISLYWKATGVTDMGADSTQRNVIALGFNAQLAG